MYYAGLVVLTAFAEGQLCRHWYFDTASPTIYMDALLTQLVTH